MKHPLLQFFAHAHLPAQLAAASKPFCEVAEKIDGMTSREREADPSAVLLELRKSLLDLPVNIESLEAAEKLDYAHEGMSAGYSVGDVLRYVLEAKDCAVRAVLFKAAT